MEHAFELMGFGLAGVFAALFILFLSVIIMGKMFPDREKKKTSDENDA